MSHQEMVLGIDGGGTKTVAWLAPLADDGTVLGHGAAGPGNPRAVGFETAQANIDAAIAAAFAEANLPQQPVVAACFGLAGCGRVEEQDRITSWAESRGIAYMIKVTTDAEPILAAASPENWGIALISGTGSFAWGRNREGKTARCGGWGYLLGDEGSGYAIALAGLRAAARAADGRGPATTLLALLQDALQAATPEELVARVYAPEMTRERLAALASVVARVRLEDAVAARIIDTAAKDLADMVLALIGRLALPPAGFPLVLGGGVLMNQTGVAVYMIEHLEQQGAKPSTLDFVPDAVRGAISLARQLAAADGSS